MDQNVKQIPKKRGRKVGSKNKKKTDIITETIIDKPIPKKRGRKPKETIIKNDNPIFNNSNDNNIIIRVKKDINNVSNVKSFDYFDCDNYQDIKYDDICHVCWNCCHKFDNNNYGLPIKYINNIFYIYGFFCSLECAARYTFDNFNNDFEIYSLINFYYNFINNTTSEKINIAPKRLVLKMFGGNMDIDEYRNNFKTNCIFYVNIPPIFPINHTINTYENNINNMNDNKKDLKLYRKNMLPNQENNITNTMNLIV